MKNNIEEIAEEIISYRNNLEILKERIIEGKKLLADREQELIKLLAGTGETVECGMHEFYCNSPIGSVEILKDVPKEYCTVKEIYNPDKKRIKEELQSGVKLDFAEIVYNTKLTIKEVIND